MFNGQGFAIHFIGQKGRRHRFVERDAADEFDPGRPQGLVEAFEADDLETAFSFASPNIQSIFGTPENFGSMVSGSYPMVWRPSDITFLNSENRNGSTWQRLKVTDRQGASYWFIYEMVLIDDKWRINGVFRIDAPGLNA